jgi:hypothetical protein
VIFLTGHFAGHVRNTVEISKTFSEPYRKFESHLVNILAARLYEPMRGADGQGSRKHRGAPVPSDLRVSS